MFHYLSPRGCFTPFLFWWNVLSGIAVKKIEWVDPVDVAKCNEPDGVVYDKNTKVLRVCCKSTGIGVQLTLTGTYAAKLDRFQLLKEMSQRMPL